MIDEMDDLYEIVGEEIKRGGERPGLMARARAEADGNPEKAKSIYIQYRVAELAENRQREAEKRVRVEAARKADPVQEKMAPIFTLLGFEVSAEEPEKWIAKERTGSGVKPPESPLAKSNAPRPSATYLTRPIRPSPNPINGQSATHSEIRTSRQPDFDLQPSDRSKRISASEEPADPDVKAANSRKRPTRWLWFYTYVYLPFGVLTSFAPALAEYDKLGEAGYQIELNSIIFAPIVVFDIFVCFLIYGLHKRRYWAWMCNWIYLGIFVLLNSAISKQSWEVYFVTVILLSLIFFLPNYIYFKKRRSLFNGKN